MPLKLLPWLPCPQTHTETAITKRLLSHRKLGSHFLFLTLVFSNFLYVCLSVCLFLCTGTKGMWCPQRAEVLEHPQLEFQAFVSLRMGGWDQTLVLSESNNHHPITSVPRLHSPNDCLSGEVFKFCLINVCFLCGRIEIVNYLRYKFFIICFIC